jgi:hypothetical protein
MSFVLSELTYIVNTLDESFLMSDIQSKINVSAGYDVDKYDNEESFMVLLFSLRNGSAKIKLCDSTGIFSYCNSNGENLHSIEFDDSGIAETNSSFRKALKQIWAFDRQNVGSVKITDASLNRASFGLAEVN